MSENWVSCDGSGGAGQPTTPGLSRRSLLQNTVASALAAWLGASALHHAAFAAPTAAPERDVLVVVFLRGGADGLSLVVPYGEDAYYRQRPTLGLGKNSVLKLDDFFGLHPSLKGMYPHYQEGRLAVAHAVGSNDRTRSHFEAMATMERGLADEKGSETSGWLARYLTGMPALTSSPLRAVAFGTILPDSLRGAPTVSTLQALENFRLTLPENSPLAATLASLYRTGDDPVTVSGRETLAVLETLRQVDPANYKASNGANYPDSDLGRGLRQVACLLHARVGLEVACLDKGGWDTHVGQGTTEGWLPSLLQDLGDSLAAFATDLGPTGLARVSVIVLTEFGRRVQENSGLGTDHGRASCLFALGGAVNGGRVYSRWPGLEKNALEEGLDLQVTTDYRDILGEVVVRRLAGVELLSRVLPGSDTARFPGIFRAA